MHDRNNPNSQQTMNRTINCPNCGVGNNLLPNMKKPKCRKCGKLLAFSAPAEATIAVSPPAPSGKTPGNSGKKRRPPKPKPSTVPEKSGVSPEVPKSETDYEV